MNKEKLKLITRNLELLIDALKVEIYSEDMNHENKKLNHPVMSYDEIYTDEEE